MHTLDLGPLQFYWRVANGPEDVSPFPEFLPFRFGFDPRHQLITQAPTAEVEDVLRGVYLEDINVGYLSAEHALADCYGQDFLEFIRSISWMRERRGLRVLDVGCGGCYLLRELQSAGHKVYGIDPSPVAARVGQRLGIPVAPSFYPAEHGFGTMDVVLSSGMLEHVTDPVGFLRAHRRDLAEDGRLLVSVPDSAASLATGDVSMVMHEHFAYFDEESLRRVLGAAGFEVLALEPAGYGASLYCFARRTRREARAAPGAGGADWAKFEAFCDRVRRARARVEDYVREALAAPGASLGFYVPLRCLPYLSMQGVRDGVRFFDDDPGLQGKCYDGFDVTIESFDDLRARPVTHLAIMSIPHAAVIEHKVRAALGDRVAVTSLARILDG